MTVRPPSSLAELRIRSHLSQAEVGAELGVSQSYVAKVERGVKTLAGHVDTLALLYQVTPDEIREAWRRSRKASA